MQYEYANSPVWANADQTAINLSVKFDDIAQEIPFTASETDTTSHGQELFTAAANGDFGPVGAYVPPGPPSQAQINAQIVRDVQDRLDTFARTRNYDGVLSLATYATSTIPKFAAEGQYGVEARDATWATLYQIQADVIAGLRPAPTGYADIEGDLPTLAWPTP